MKNLQVIKIMLPILQLASRMIEAMVEGNLVCLDRRGKKDTDWGKFTAIFFSQRNRIPESRLPKNRKEPRQKGISPHELKYIVPPDDRPEVDEIEAVRKEVYQYMREHLYLAFMAGETDPHGLGGMIYTNAFGVAVPQHFYRLYHSRKHWDFTQSQNIPSTNQG